VPDTNVPTLRQPDPSPALPPWPMPPMLTALGRGVRGLCPVCGQTRAFSGYLTVVPQCLVCGTPLGEVRADDAPPYFTIVIVGHIVIGSMLLLDQAYAPPLWLQAVIWLPMTVILALALLRPVKGATLGLMLKLGMFKPADE
jgi:uncharacterized protein (DUF983 family)